MTLLSSLIFLSLLSAGLLVPGWLLSRLLHTPSGPTVAFLGSAVIVFNLLLVLDGLDVPLTADRIAISLALVCAALAVAAKLRPSKAPANIEVKHAAFSWQRGYWLLLPAAWGLGAIVVKATVDPLSGYDTFFRWDFLAQQMMKKASLHFYPPISANDFLQYGWCDGIAPLISTLYFWTYTSLGQVVAWATAPVVIGQAALLFGVVYQLASLRGGMPAGCAAIALLATSPVLLWGVSMGQETGLTALSFVAMFLFIARHHQAPEKSWLVWAGLAAGTGALAREYGLAFIGSGGIALAWRSTPRRGWFQFLFTATLVALPWYARNWLKTGNPLYSQNFFGLFPVNPVNAEYLRITHETTGLATQTDTIIHLGILLGGLAGIPLLIGSASMLKFRRELTPWLAAILGVVAFWFWSSVRTSGGLVYSLRVLTPAIGLAAAAGGPLVAKVLATGRGWLAAVLLGLLAIDAAERSLFMPVAPAVAWWKTSTPAWQEYRKTNEAWNQHPDWTAVAEAAESKNVLVTDPYSYTTLSKLGANPVPIFSPSVRFLFDPDAGLETGSSQLRATGMRFILVSNNRIVGPQLSSHLFFQSLLATRPVMATPLFSLYDLYPENLRITAPLIDAGHPSGQTEPAQRKRP